LAWGGAEAGALGFGVFERLLRAGGENSCLDGGQNVGDLALHLRQLRRCPIRARQPLPFPQQARGLLHEARNPLQGKQVAADAREDLLLNQRARHEQAVGAALDAIGGAPVAGGVPHDEAPMTRAAAQEA